MIYLKDTNLICVNDLQRLADNIAVSKNLRDAFPNPYQIEDAQQFIELARAGVLGHVFGIFEEDTFIGVGSIVPQRDVYKNNGEIGYWIGEPYWGKGYGSKAVELLTSYAFDELKLLRVYAGVFENNTASMKVLEKSGYILEAILKSAIIKNGEILDEYLYSIINL